MTETTESKTLDVTPLHRDLYTAVAVGGLTEGKRRGIEAIRKRWHQTETVLNQMLDLAQALDDPYIAARVEDIQEERKSFFQDVLDAFKTRFESARELVESDCVEFSTQQKNASIDDYQALHRFAPGASCSMYAISYDEYGNIRSQYSVGFANGAPVVPTGDTVNRPHVILEKYAISHALTKGRVSHEQLSENLVTA